MGLQVAQAMVAYGDAISAGEILERVMLLLRGDGGGYANGGGGGFIAEDGIEPGVCTGRNVLPDVPASPIFFSPLKIGIHVHLIR
jgi:hypothetical protein